MKKITRLNISGKVNCYCALPHHTVEQALTDIRNCLSHSRSFVHFCVSDDGLPEDHKIFPLQVLQESIINIYSEEIYDE